MSRTDAQHIADAEEHLRVLKRHLGRGDLEDDTIFDAVCLRLSAAVESVGCIDEATRDREFGTNWAAIWSVRNRISHGYMYVDQRIIIDTVENDLPAFEQSLDRLAKVLKDDRHLTRNGASGRTHPRRPVTGDG